MTASVAIGIDDVARLGAHGVFQGIGLCCVGTWLQFKYLMGIRIERHIAHLADAQGVVIGKVIQKFFRRFHGRCITCIAAKVRVHGVGDIHDDDHGHVRLLDDFVDDPGRLHGQGDVKDVFDVRSGDGLADRNAVLIIPVRATGLIDLSGRRFSPVPLCLYRIQHRRFLAVARGISGAAVFLEPAAVPQQNPVVAHAGFRNALAVDIQPQNDPHTGIQFQVGFVRKPPDAVCLFQPFQQRLGRIFVQFFRSFQCIHLTAEPLFDFRKLFLRQLDLAQLVVGMLQ